MCKELMEAQKMAAQKPAEGAVLWWPCAENLVRNKALVDDQQVVIEVEMGFEARSHGMRYFGQTAVEKEAACLLAGGAEITKSIDKKLSLPICDRQQLFPTMCSYPLSWVLDEDPGIKRHSDSMKDYTAGPPGLVSMWQTVTALPVAHFKEPDEASFRTPQAQAEPADMLLGADFDFGTAVKTAVEAGFQEAAQRWLSKLLYRKIAPSELVDATCQGGALTMRVCNLMLLQLKDMSAAARQEAVHETIYQQETDDCEKEQISIVAEFVSKLMESGILDSEVEALECVEHIQDDILAFQNQTHHKESTTSAEPVACQESKIDDQQLPSLDSSPKQLLSEPKQSQSFCKQRSWGGA